MKRVKQEQKRIMEKNKKRWKKKIEGEDYVSDGEGSRSMDDGFSMHRMHDELEPLEGDFGQEYEYRRRKDFLNETKEPSFQIESSHDHRRKRFDDLKSVQVRKKEQEINDGNPWWDGSLPQNGGQV